MADHAQAIAARVFGRIAASIAAGGLTAARVYANIRAMNAPARKLITVDEFLAWSESQSEGRYELHDGHIVRMQSEQANHRRLKAGAFMALRAAIRRAGLPCHAEMDGATIRISEHTAYEPDASVYCGPRVPGESLIVPNPMIVVEALSPSTKRKDLGDKARDYFTLPSLHHYLILDAKGPTLSHWARAADGSAEKRVVTAVLTLDPPGLVLPVAEFFEDF
jgi:Uma2 family endonuclease